jgi:hypothetical protein
MWGLREVILISLGVLAIVGCTPKDAIRIELAPGVTHPDYGELIDFMKSAGFQEAQPEAYDRPIEQPPGALRSSYWRSATLSSLRCAVDEVTPPKPLDIVCFEVREARLPRGMSPEGASAVKQLVEGLKQRYGPNIIR